ncbi:epidermal growth factor receptor-like [Ptychodera flava]|uniref:epidermal growth factor receptor-like n=1 Tax=Ptychodera flava TaxID=63121 RepID=UPI003969DC4C
MKMAWTGQFSVCVFALLVAGNLPLDVSSTVDSCPEGQIAKDGECQGCEGLCPKTCLGFGHENYTGGEQIHNGNIEDFRDCTIINGSIVISAVTYGGDPGGFIAVPDQKIEILKTIRIVTGYVAVTDSKLSQADLSILKNLEIIQGNVLLKCDDLRESLHDASDKTDVCNILKRSAGYALSVTGTYLKSLGLVSLREIHRGSIYIRDNKHLCYTKPDMFNDIIQDNATQVISIGKNREQYKCEGKVCDGQCTSTGCWGPGNDKCVECRNYKLEDQCIERCDTDNGQYVISETDKECGLCHPECRGSCNGPGPANCTKCKNMKDGPICLAQCPVDKYPDLDNTCHKCDANCKLDGENPGCNGPSDFIDDDDGCKSCGQILWNNSKAACMVNGSQCPQRYYLNKHTEGPYIDTLVCQACNEECESCFGDGAENCKECRRYKQGNRCVPQCFPNYYPDDNKICQRCNEECQGGCHGDGPTQCNQCKNYQIPMSNDEQGNVTFCVSKCPQNQPYTSIMDDKVCVSNCTDSSYYADEKTKLCEACHIQCTDGCTGGSAADCVKCKNYRLLTGQCVESCLHPLVDDGNGLCQATSSPSSAIIVGCVMGVIVVAIIVLLVVGLLMRRKHKQEKMRKFMQDEYKMDTFAEPLAPSGAAPNKAYLRIIKETELKKGGILGSGAFGTVYKGIWLPEGDDVRIPVAIKVMREGITTKANQELLEEAYVMATVHHDHLVRLLCVCMAQNMMLITQLMPLGALLDYVREHKDKVSSQHLLNWCTQIAKGMVYLEEHRLVHRDLAARNVLVESPTKVKITDFGLAKFIEINEEEYKAEGGKMPIKWLALECITHRRFTHQSDVWSFGVTAWELMTFGGRPYEGVKAKDVPNLIEMGERLPQPQICTIDVYMLMLKCWMLHEESRPTFKELVQNFSKMAQDPQRFLMLESECEEPLPSPSKEEYYRNLVPDEESELLMDADDYLQPVTTLSDGTDGSDSGIPHNYNGASNSAALPHIYSDVPSSEV